MTIMSSYHHPYLLSNNSISKIVIAPLILLCFLLFLSPISCLYQQNHLSPSPEESVFVEKTRLGSTPPSCHNKCNGCHPCMAAQVPTIPSHSRFQQTATELLDPSANRYSNYKPLGWKCRCGDHFYNP